MSSVARVTRRSRRGAPLVIAALTAVTLACGRNESRSVRVMIPTGASMWAAAESLQHAGVIGSPRMFRLYAWVRRSDRGIKPGTYLLRRNSSWGSVLSALRNGRGIVNVVTIPEGYTLAQIDSLLVHKLGVPAESVTVAVSDTNLLRRLDVPTSSVEGYLFPDTYYFPPGTTAREVVNAMVRRFEQQWRTEWGLRLDTLQTSRHDLLTLASIVEREARLPQERPIIAAVYWNRLRRGMLLQADPTVQYALPQHQSRLLYRHLRVKSPYNTYRKAGLPPGPIGSPGLASVRATLDPANVPFRYFVAYPDGHHEFRLTLQQHEEAKRLARRAWNALNTRQAQTKKPATSTTGRTPAP